MTHNKLRRYLLIVLTLLLHLSCAPQVSPRAHPVAEPDHSQRSIVYIATKERTLTVVDHTGVTAKFERISFGSSGVGIKRKRGDNITPLGRFTIGWINKRSKFGIFLGLNYPSLEYARRAYHEGKISVAELLNISAALNNDRIPPQDTSLGGYIGIHGIGKGSMVIHRIADWTDGCIALTNEQMRKLVELIHQGTIVIIE